MSPKLHIIATKISIHAPAYVNYALSYAMMPKEVEKRGDDIKISLKQIASPSTFRKLSEEYAEVLYNIAPYKNKPFHTLRTVHDGTITREAGLFIYGIIRTTKPSNILETGIYNGFSTAIMLSALNRNGYGQLYSTDINPNVGRLLADTDLGRWNKRIGKPGSILKDTLKEMDKLDIFMHDSDHSYKNMLYEFNCAYAKMKRTGIIVSDDVDMNESFWDFARQKRLRPRVVYSPIKLYGVIYLSEKWPMPQ